MAAQLLAGAEILIDAPMAARGRRMLNALAATAPAGSVVTTAYRGAHWLLVMYGAGLPAREQAMRQHLQAGGRVATWDLGYWDREDAMRVAMDGLHPTAAQLEQVPAGCRRPVVLREDADPAGPALLIGIGPKSCGALGLGGMEWERAALAALRRQNPARRVLWRPKGRAATALAGTTLAHGMPIEAALRGCSLVVTRHSNCAVDACIAGVPVRCEAGAAQALYAAGEAPTREARAEFLRRLGWFNWRPAEAAQAWQQIERLTR